MNGHESNDQYLEEYLLLCRRIYERHVREGTWPTDEEWEARQRGEDAANPRELSS